MWEGLYPKAWEQHGIKTLLLFQHKKYAENRGCIGKNKFL